VTTNRGRADRPQTTFQATVSSKAEEPDGYVLFLEIPHFQSNWDTKVTRVTPDLASELKVGSSYNLILERQSIKKGKDGERLYDYYWGLVGISDEEFSEPTLADVGLSGGDSQAQPHAQPRERGLGPRSRVDPILGVDMAKRASEADAARAKRDSIEAQVALKEAWSAAVVTIDGDSISREELHKAVREHFFFSISLMQESREQVGDE